MPLFKDNHEDAKKAKKHEGFHAKAQRKGKEDCRLNFRLILRVHWFVPTPPELQTEKSAKQALTALRFRSLRPPLLSSLVITTEAPGH
jgi:hypothetical protein